MKRRVEEIIWSKWSWNCFFIFHFSISYITTYLPHCHVPGNLTSCSSRRKYFFDLKLKQIWLILECHNGLFQVFFLLLSKRERYRCKPISIRDIRYPLACFSQTTLGSKKYFTCTTCVTTNRFLLILKTRMLTNFQTYHQTYFHEKMSLIVLKHILLEHKVSRTHRPTQHPSSLSDEKVNS